MGKELGLKDILKSDTPDDLIRDLKFEQAMAYLEELVSEVEGGELPLEAAMQSYEVGSLLVNRSRELLAGAEKKLKLLDKNSPNKKQK